MQNRPSVSVIVPVYNAELYLERCLASVLHQTTDDYELICVNDCSSDSSETILEQMVPFFGNRMRVLHNKENAGGGKSREYAIEVAAGEYVTFIDSDDYIAPDYIETYLKEALRTKTDVIVGGYTKDINGKLARHKPVQGIWSLTTYSISCAKLYKTSFLRQNSIRYSDIRCGEDIYFGIDLLYSHATFSVFPYCGYHYYFNPSSTTNSMKPNQQMEQNISTIFQQFATSHDLTRISSEDYQVIEYTYLANMINALLVYGRGCGINEMRSKIAFFRSDVKRQFPYYRSNRFLNPFIARGQSGKIRLSVSLLMLLERVRLDTPIYLLIALL